MMKLTSHQYGEAQRRSILFEKPDFIPMRFAINGACWHTYPQEALFELMESHPFLFPDFQRPEGEFVPQHHLVARKGQPYKDDWGCVWETTMEGITGTVTGHPLQDWSDFKNYPIPDPEKCMGIGPVDWAAEQRSIEQAHKNGGFVQRGLRHGHTFLQVCDIRGYENVLFDMEDEEPLLEELLEKITEFNLGIIQRYVELGADLIAIPEDLGMQVGPMLSPDNFRKYIIPCYHKLVAPIKKGGCLVHMHSDGDIRSLIPALMECDMNVLNLQDLVNGIDWIKDNLKGKVCIDLDIDRQLITPFGTPKEVDELILKEVRQLGSREGGLTMVYGLYPGVPLENVKALMDAMEKYAFYYG